MSAAAVAHVYMCVRMPRVAIVVPVLMDIEWSTLCVKVGFYTWIPFAFKINYIG